MDHAYSPILSNLAKACEKQYQARAAELFRTLAEFFDKEPEGKPATGFSGVLNCFRRTIAQAGRARGRLLRVAECENAEVLQP